MLFYLCEDGFLSLLIVADGKGHDHVKVHLLCTEGIQNHWRDSPEFQELSDFGDRLTEPLRDVFDGSPCIQHGLVGNESISGMHVRAIVFGQTGFDGFGFGLHDAPDWKLGVDLSLGKKVVQGAESASTSNNLITSLGIG